MALQQMTESLPTLTRPAGNVRAEAGGDFFTLALNGFLLGSYMAFNTVKTTRMILGSFMFAAIFIYFNLRGRKANAVTTVWKEPGLRWGAALLALNWVIMGVQGIFKLGLTVGVEVAIGEALMLLMLLMLTARHGQLNLSLVLKTLALAFVWFGIINWICYKVNYDPGMYTERQSLYESRYSEGEGRWVAPLYSSWQLSGLLRWCVPVMLFWLLRRDINFLQRIILLLTLTVAAFLLRKIEFRAAIFPSIGWVIWRLIPSRFGRAILSGTFVTYAFLAPVIMTSPGIQDIMEQLIPEWVLQLAGRQSLQDLASLSNRTDIWTAGLESLTDGKYLFYGVGHVRLNTFEQSAFGEGEDVSVLQGGSMSFHQGFLDLAFIYGLLPALVLGAAFFICMWRAVWQIRRLPEDSSAAQEMQWALLSLSMVGLSNCHDGFFVSHNFFYFICIVCIAGMLRLKPGDSPAVIGVLPTLSRSPV